MPTDNYFVSGIDAARYSRARPPIHASVVERIRAFVHGVAPFARALDVGCGTGQSTVALAAIAESVVGIDPSAAMLAHALPHARVSYREAAAEDVPFPHEYFDLITAGLAFHWFDHEAFFAEVRRLMIGSGWLVIYNSGFTGEMREESAVASWFRDDFLMRYPTPSRNFSSATFPVTEANGLVLRHEESFSNDIEMSIDGFIDYELSTTNIISAARRGGSFEAAEAWMQASLASILQGRQRGTFSFAGRMSYLQKQAA